MNYNNILPIDKFLIIEIGPGPGGLTRSILKYRPREVILIEKDNIFKRGLEEIFTEFNDIKIKLILNDCRTCSRIYKAFSNIFIH